MYKHNPVTTKLPLWIFGDCHLIVALQGWVVSCSDVVSVSDPHPFCCPIIFKGISPGVLDAVISLICTGWLQITFPCRYLTVGKHALFFVFEHGKHALFSCPYIGKIDAHNVVQCP